MTEIKQNQVRYGTKGSERCTNPASSVVTAAHCFVSTYIQATHALGMALKHTKQLSVLDIPYTQHCIVRAGYSNQTIVQHADAMNCRSVTT